MNLKKYGLILLSLILLIGGVCGYIVFQKNKSTDTSAKTEQIQAKAWDLDKLVSDQGRNVLKLDYSKLHLSKLSQVYTTDVQNQISAQLATLKNKRKYSLTKPLLVSNPYLTNTTGLYIYFETDKAVKVNYTVEAKGYQDYSAKLYNPQGTYAKKHEYQLIGAVAGVKNKITITTTDKQGKQTKKVLTYKPNKLQSVASNQYEVSKTSSKQKLSSGLYVVIGLQAATNIRASYYVDNSGVIRAEIPLLGYNSMRFIMTAKHEFYLGLNDQKIGKLNRLGKLTQIIDCKSQGYKLHHDFATDSKGDIWALATSTKKEKESQYVEDYLIKIDHQTGKVTKAFDMQDLLPELYKQAKGIEKHSNNIGLRDVVHLNTIQIVNDGQVIVSSRETSTIIKLSQINTNPKITYFIANQSIWEKIGDYSKYLLTKKGDFLDQTGQHSVTYQTDSKLKDGQYYLYMFDNNSALMDSRPDFSWKALKSLATNGVKLATKSMYYKYLVDEKQGTYELVDSFTVPYSAYVSSVQNYQGNIVVTSGGKNMILEYSKDGKLLQSLTYPAKSSLTYRTFKYDFTDIYFRSE